MVGCLGVSETSGGSDVAALKTTARRDGDDYLITLSIRDVEQRYEGEI